MSKIPTVEEFFEQHIQRGVNNTHSNYLNTAIEFAKLHVEAALLEASEKATVNINGFIQEYDENCCVDKDSILNTYPLKNIK